MFFGKISPFRIAIFIAIIFIFIEMCSCQSFHGVQKSFSNSKKMFIDTDGIMDMIISFILDLVEMGSGVMEMVMAMGRKKRSLLEEILTPTKLR